jgi:hypothetical protein
MREFNKVFSSMDKRRESRAELSAPFYTRPHLRNGARSARAGPMTTAGGLVFIAATVDQDLTNRKRSEKKIQEQSNLLEPLPVGSHTI